MTGRWWVGVAAGVVLGLGSVVAVEVATDDASAQSGFTLSREQLRTNQKISVAAVKRVNQAQKDIAALGAAAPLYAVSSGAVGSNLVRGRGAVSSQLIGEGNYRVKFTREHQHLLLVGDRRRRRAAHPVGGLDPARARHDRRGPDPADRADLPGKRQRRERRLPPPGVLLMRTRWWAGVAAGVVLGLAVVVGVEAGTDDASAQGGFAATAEQLRTNQRISIAAVRRSNEALNLLDPIRRQPKLPQKVLGWRTQDLRDGAVSAAKIANGAVSDAKLASSVTSRLASWAVVGANGALARSSGGITSQRTGEGAYRVDFNRNVGQCAWTATLVVSSAADLGDIGAAIDPVDSERLVVFTTDNANPPVAADRAFNLQLTC